MGRPAADELGPRARGRPPHDRVGARRLVSATSRRRTISIWPLSVPARRHAHPQPQNVARAPHTCGSGRDATSGSRPAAGRAVSSVTDTRIRPWRASGAESDRGGGLGCRSAGQRHDQSPRRKPRRGHPKQRSGPGGGVDEQGSRDGLEACKTVVLTVGHDEVLDRRLTTTSSSTDIRNLHLNQMARIRDDR